MPGIWNLLSCFGHLLALQAVNCNRSCCTPPAPTAPSCAGSLLGQQVAPQAATPKAAYSAATQPQRQAQEEGNYCRSVAGSAGSGVGQRWRQQHQGGRQGDAALAEREEVEEAEQRP